MTAGLYGKSSSEVMTGIMGQKTEGIFKKFLSFLNPIFGVFGRIFKIFQNPVQNVSKPKFYKGNVCIQKQKEA